MMTRVIFVGGTAEPRGFWTWEKWMDVKVGNFRIGWLVRMAERMKEAHKIGRARGGCGCLKMVGRGRGSDFRLFGTAVGAERYIFNF